MSDFADINNNTEEFCRLQYNNFSTPDGGKLNKYLSNWYAEPFV